MSKRRVLALAVVLGLTLALHSSASGQSIYVDSTRGAFAVETEYLSDGGVVSALAVSLGVSVRGRLDGLFAAGRTRISSKLKGWTYMMGGAVHPIRPSRSFPVGVHINAALGVQKTSVGETTTQRFVQVGSGFYIPMAATSSLDIIASLGYGIAFLEIPNGGNWEEHKSGLSSLSVVVRFPSGLAVYVRPEIVIQSHDDLLGVAVGVIRVH